MKSRVMLVASGIAGALVAVGQLGVSPMPGADEQLPTVDATEYSAPAEGSVGPDVVYTNCQGTNNYGAIGGIRGYALGSWTCNIGDENLLWGTTHNGTPILGMNAYRLHEGRLTQIGLSFGKHACCAAAGNGCGLNCNNQGGSLLGVGCRDIYSAGWNGGQSRLGPRSNINAFSGEMQGAPGGSGNAIFRRLQIAEADMDSGNFPGAQFFVEGVYVGMDEAQWPGNALNNASYQRSTVSGGSFNINIQDTMEVGSAAIYAWRDHGNGANNSDPSVKIVAVDIPNEGRLIAGAKAIDMGGGEWRYEYAIFNLNSHRSAGSFDVPVDSQADVTGVGFSDVDYHSGEVYDNTDWGSVVSSAAVQWTSPQTFDENPNTNALRWGTTYSFWFTCDAPPVTGNVTIGMFRPGTPDSVEATLIVPSPVDANTVLPTSFQTLFGDERSGVTADLYFSDDDRVEIEQRAAVTPLLPLIRLQATGNADSDTASSLGVTLEASATSVPTLPPQRLSLFDYVANSWEAVDNRTATSNDSVVNVTINTNPGRFLQSGTAETQMRIDYFDPGNVFFPAWMGRVDQAIWSVVP